MEIDERRVFRKLYNHIRHHHSNRDNELPVPDRSKVTDMRSDLRCCELERAQEKLVSCRLLPPQLVGAHVTYTAGVFFCVLLKDYTFPPRMTSMLLLAALTWASLSSSVMVSGVDVCGTMPGCTCLRGVGAEREVQCGKEGIGVTAIVRPKNELEIKCRFNVSTPQHLEMLAGLQAGPVRVVKIYFCPMPVTPLSNLLETITGGALNQTEKLYITSHGMDLDLTGHFQGFTGLSVLEISNNMLRDVPENMLETMRNLTWLTLRQNGITSVPPKLLQNSPKISVLEMGNNAIAEIPDGLFENLNNLKRLNLWLNKFSTLNETVFASLTSLEDLDLSNNGLDHLPEKIFYNLTRLKDLHLSGNNFTSMPAGLFQNLKNLTRLRILDSKSSNLILTSGLFANLPNLREIVISNSGITELPGDLFANSSSLTNLTMSGNKLTSLPARFFIDNVNLTMLDIGNNLLSNLSDDTFVGLGNLLILRLNNNKLENISEAVLQPLTLLGKIDLSSNQIEYLPRSAFRSMEKLRVIELQNNQLAFQQAVRDFFGYYSPFHTCIELEKLDLSNNSISEIANDWRNSLLKLQSLNLAYNNLTQLTVHDLHFLSDTLIVDLRHNQITEVDMSFVELIAQQQPIEETVPPKKRDVQILLGHNSLDCTSCNNYELLRYREERMDKSVNKFVRLNTSNLTCSDKRSFSQVSSLNFTCTFPQPQCPEQCSECKRQPSRTAFIMHCCETPKNLSHVLLRNIINRTELVSEACGLEKAPIIQNMTVTTLKLGGNNISEFNLRSLPQRLLETLELHNNNLSSLSEAVLMKLENFSSLKRLTLAGNPWHCDCQARDLLTYVQSHFELVADLANVSCSDGRFLHELSTNDICSSTTAVATSMTVAVLGLLLGAAAAAYYRYQHEIKVWLYARNLCLWFVTEDELDKDKKYDAFVSYSHKDEEFVAEHLMPGLEPPFKLCIHVRDWVAGDWIPEQIARSVQHSRRTLVVLSTSFIESAMSEGRVRVIVILLEDVGPVDKLDPELRAYLTMNTYLKWGEPWFWEKLRFALPHRSDLPGVETSWGWGRHRVAEAPSVLARRIEDKLEFMCSNVIVSPPSPSNNTPPAAVNGVSKQNGHQIKTPIITT
ncbi:hypothetical protein B566_EDAN004716 [Ephemera danica]|nr:hypothetical protein B566_EDAN004716 [Ephemera danica]